MCNNSRTTNNKAAAETRFRLLKDPAFLDAMYLKQPHRIEALGMLMVIAGLILKKKMGLKESRRMKNLKMN